MRNIAVRIVATLLVPALVLDPVSAVPFHSAVLPSSVVRSVHTPPLFQSQAVVAWIEFMQKTTADVPGRSAELNNALHIIRRHLDGAESDETLPDNFDVLAQNAVPSTKKQSTGSMTVRHLLKMGATGAIVGHSETRRLLEAIKDIWAAYPEVKVEGNPLPFSEQPAYPHIMSLLNHTAVVARTDSPEINTTLDEMTKDPDVKSVLYALGEPPEVRKMYPDDEERQLEAAKDFVKRMLDVELAGLSAEQISKLIIMYEPTWAIKGPGFVRNSTERDAQEMGAFIRAYVVEKFSPEAARKVRIGIGGSVDKNNILGYMSQPDIDAVLPGTASTKLDHWESMLTIVADLYARHKGDAVLYKDGRVPYVGGNWKHIEGDQELTPNSYRTYAENTKRALDYAASLEIKIQAGLAAGWHEISNLIDAIHRAFRPTPTDTSVEASHDHVTQSGQDVIQRGLLPAGPGTVLSIGISAAGHDEIAFAKHNPSLKIKGTTIDSVGLSITRENIRESGLGKQIQVEYEDVTKKFPYPDQSVDFVYARLVLHYLSAQEFDFAMAEIQRVLKPGGKIYVVVKSDHDHWATHGEPVFDPKTELTEYLDDELNPARRLQRQFISEQRLRLYAVTAGLRVESISEGQEILYKDFGRAIPTSTPRTYLTMVATKPSTTSLIKELLQSIGTVPELPWEGEERFIVRAHGYDSDAEAEKKISGLDKMDADKRREAEAGIIAKLEKYIALREILRGGLKALFAAPVESLILPPALIKALVGIEIRTVGQLLAIPEADVEALSPQLPGVSNVEPYAGRYWRVEVKKVLYDLGLRWGQMPPLVLLSSKATSDLFAELAETLGFSAAADAAGNVVDRVVEKNEEVDIVVVASDALEKFKDKLLPGSRMDFVKSRISVAVSVGAPQYKIDTEEDVKAAFRAAKTIGYSESASGMYVLELLERWGMLEEIKPKLVLAPRGKSVGDLLANGQAELGLQQTSEIKKAEKKGGIVVRGELPDSIQKTTVFSAAVTAASKLLHAAILLLKDLASGKFDDVIRRHWMDPAAPSAAAPQLRQMSELPAEGPAFMKINLDIGKKLEPTKIEQTAETIVRAVNRHGEVFLNTHFLRPKAGTFDEKFSIRRVTDVARPILKQALADAGVDAEIVDLPYAPELIPTAIAAARTAHPGKKIIFAMENVRFYPGEKSKNPTERKIFAQWLKDVTGAKVYIDEAFESLQNERDSSMEMVELFNEDHRAAGLVVNEEVPKLIQFDQEARHPRLYIYAGAKFDKLVRLRDLLKYDQTQPGDIVAIQGALAYPVLQAQGHGIGASLMPPEAEAKDLDLENVIPEIFRLAKEKNIELILPQDHIAEKENGSVQRIDEPAIPEGVVATGIGPKTIDLLRQRIREIKNRGYGGIVFNGGVGRVDFEQSRGGTAELLDEMSQAADQGIPSLTAGGDIDAAINMVESFDWGGRKISPKVKRTTGGGVVLEGLARGILSLKTVQALLKTPTLPAPEKAPLNFLWNTLPGTVAGVLISFFALHLGLPAMVGGALLGSLVSHYLNEGGHKLAAGRDAKVSWFFGIPHAVEVLSGVTPRIAAAGPMTGIVGGLLMFKAGLLLNNTVLLSAGTIALLVNLLSSIPFKRVGLSIHASDGDYMWRMNWVDALYGSTAFGLLLYMLAQPGHWIEKGVGSIGLGASIFLGPSEEAWDGHIPETPNQTAKTYRVSTIQSRRGQVWMVSVDGEPRLQILDNGRFFESFPVGAVENDWQAQQHLEVLYNYLSLYRERFGRDLQVIDSVVRDTAYSEVSQEKHGTISEADQARWKQGTMDRLDIYRFLARWRGTLIPLRPVYHAPQHPDALPVALQVNPTLTNVEAAIVRRLMDNPDVNLAVVIGTTPQAFWRSMHHSALRRFLARKDFDYDEKFGIVTINGKKIRVVKAWSDLGENGNSHGALRYTVVSTSHIYSQKDAITSQLGQKEQGAGPDNSPLHFISMQSALSTKTTPDTKFYAEGLTDSASPDTLAERSGSSDIMLVSSLARVPALLLTKLLHNNEALSEAVRAVRIEAKTPATNELTILDKSGKPGAQGNYLRANELEYRTILEKILPADIVSRHRLEESQVVYTQLPAGTEVDVAIRFPLREAIQALGLSHRDIPADPEALRRFVVDNVLKPRLSEDDSANPLFVFENAEMVNSYVRGINQVVIAATGVRVSVVGEKNNREVTLTIPLFFDHLMQDARQLSDVLETLGKSEMSHRPTVANRLDDDLSEYERQRGLALTRDTLPPVEPDLPDFIELLETPLQLGVIGEAGRTGSLFFRQLYTTLNVAPAAVIGADDSAESGHALQIDSAHSRWRSNGEDMQIDTAGLSGSSFGQIGNLRINGGRPIPILQRQSRTPLINWAHFGVEWVIDATGPYIDPTDVNGLLGHAEPARGTEQGQSPTGATFGASVTNPFKLGGNSKIVKTSPATPVATVPAKVKIEDPTIVFGVNHGNLKEYFRRQQEKGKALIVSSASCTTNCALQLLNALNLAFSRVTEVLNASVNWGVLKGIISPFKKITFELVGEFGITVHAWTNTQFVADRFAPGFGARQAAGFANIIPLETGLSDAIKELGIMADHAKIIVATADRVPTETGSHMVISSNFKLHGLNNKQKLAIAGDIEALQQLNMKITLTENQQAEIKKIKKNIEKAVGEQITVVYEGLAQHPAFQQIIEHARGDEATTSAKIVGSRASAVLDSQGMEKAVRLFVGQDGDVYIHVVAKAWYDNETGYSHMLVRLLEFIGREIRRAVSHRTPLSDELLAAA